MESSSQTSDPVKMRLQNWKRTLLDLSRRNRLINFRPSKSSTVGIVDELPVEVYRMLVKERKAMFFKEKPEDDNQISDPVDEEVNVEDQIADEEEIVEDQIVDENEIPTKYLDKYLQTDFELPRLKHNLLRIHNLARTAMEEQGYNNLFLAMGFLEWIEDERFGKQKSPLILVPVKLSRQSVGHMFKVTVLDEDPIFNPALIRKLEESFNIVIGEMPDDVDEIDIQNIFTDIRDKIKNYPEWSITNDIYLGLFRYAKFIMYKDLEAHEEILEANGTVQKLSGVYTEENKEIKSKLDTDDIESLLPPWATNQIMDADSSQQEAILLVRDGANLVLQGPPGTGKSQTIANIIAEMLGAGKKVLFVSEKMAALEVVKRRLEKVGLGPFCLELHSNKSNKRAVMEELSLSMEVKLPNLDYDESNLKRLGKLRDELDIYLKDLHNPFGSLELSAFDAYGILETLKDVPEILSEIPGLEDVTSPQLREMMQAGDDLSRQLEIVGNPQKHPWYGAANTDDSFTKSNNIKEKLAGIRNHTMSLLDGISAFSSKTGFENAQSISQINDQLDKIAEVIKEPTSGLECAPSQIASQLIARRELTLKLDKTLKREFFEMDVAGWLDRWSKYEKTIFRFFMSGFWKDRTIIFKLIKPRAKRPKYREVMEDALKAKNLNVEVVSYFRKCASELETDRKPFLDSRSSYSEETAFDSNRGFGCIFDDVNLNVLSNRLNLMYENLEELGRWAKFQVSYQACIDTPMGPFVDQWIGDDRSGEHLSKSFNRLFLRKWLDVVFSQKASLQRFDGQRREQDIKEFQDLDVYQMKSAIKRIISQLAKNRPDMGWQASKNSELGILQRECKRKRGHKPIRILFNKLIPNIITDIKPCFMMSPISVAQYIDPEVHKFDVCIFDEASQITPEDAIGSIIRGKQLVVVGDSQQLPPTSFFKDAGVEQEEEDDEYNFPELESILDECASTGFPQRMLQWHYRSRHESLIAFSNKYYYDNRLNTFPSSDNSPDALGVSMVYDRSCVYDSGKSRTNRAQAKQVAQAVIEHVKRNPDKTLGVGTFSQAQQDAVIDALEQARRENMELESFFNQESDEPFFVKNLENIQGDERDVIFISVGYGPDQEGKMRMNFGPVNVSGGHRRLNVLVTRARWRLVIFSSIRGDDIDISRTDSEGAKLLKYYLEYAEKGSKVIEADDTHQPGKLVAKSFKKAVFDELIEQGLNLDNSIGCSSYKIDFAVKDNDNPDKYLLGIECDDREYAFSRTTRDRDRTRPFVLGRLGWSMKRIWSTDWFRDKDRQIEEILKAVKQVKTGNIENEPNKTQTTVNEHDEIGGSNSGRSKKTDSADSIVGYKLARVKKKGQPEDFADAPTSKIAEVLHEVVLVESPIHLDDAAIRVAMSWRRQKTTNVVRDKVSEAARYLKGRGLINIKGKFLWDINMTECTIRSREDDDVPRQAHCIAPEEYSEAIALVLSKEYRLTRDDLANQVRHVFGFQRGGTDLAKETLRVIELMLSQGELTQDGDFISKS